MLPLPFSLGVLSLQSYPSSLPGIKYPLRGLQLSAEAFALCEKLVNLENTKQ